MSTHTRGPFTAIIENVSEADAHLIAAAPDMLEALRNLADVSRAYLEHMDVDDITALEAARAAIAKAEGK